MNTIKIHQLSVKAKIGAYEWEQHIEQTLYIDVELSCDVEKAARTDQLSDALDYAALASAITEFVRLDSCRLIETLAIRLREFLLSQYSLESLKLTITKPHAIPNAQGVSIRLG